MRKQFLHNIRLILLTVCGMQVKRCIWYKAVCFGNCGIFGWLPDWNRL